MAKLSTMFFVLIAIQACLMLYQDIPPDATDLWNFVWGMDSWGTETFLLSLTAIAAALFASGITSGTLFGFKTDFLIMGPAIAGLLTIGAIFTNLASQIQVDLNASFFPGCVGLDVCSPSLFFIAITIGPLAFYYAWTVVEWWRGKDL